MYKKRLIAAVALSAALLLATVPGLAQTTEKDFWTNFTLVNLGADVAEGTISYIEPDGSEWGSEDFTISEAGGQAIFRQYLPAGEPGNPNLEDGGGSVVVSANKPLGGVVQFRARGQDPTSNGAYSSFSAGDLVFYVPLAAKELTTASGVGNSQIVVQNVGDAAADVEIELVDTNGATTYIADGSSLAAGASWYYDLADESDSNVPDGWYGSAIARTTTEGGAIVAAANFFTDDGMQTFNAFSASVLSEKWFVPLFTSRLTNMTDNLSTPISVQNLSGSSMAAGDIEVVCKPYPTIAGAYDPITLTNDSLVGDSVSYFFNPIVDATIPEGFYGSCTVDAPGDVAVFVQMRFLHTSDAAAYEAIPLNGTIERLLMSAPLVAKRLENGFATAVTVQNLDEVEAAVVDITYTPAPEYVTAGGSAEVIEIEDVEIPAGDSLIHNHRIMSGPGAVTELPEGWFGTMVIESSGQPINGFVQLTFLRGVDPIPPVPGGDTFMAHNALALE